MRIIHSVAEPAFFHGMAFGIVRSMEVIHEHIRTLFDHELRSLCTTCNHRATCTYRQQSSKVIIQCELFSIPEITPLPVVKQSAPVAQRNALGLCDTCVHQRTCSYFKRNGYVWHCEEFA